MCFVTTADNLRGYSFLIAFNVDKKLLCAKTVLTITFKIYQSELVLKIADIIIKWATKRLRPIMIQKENTKSPYLKFHTLSPTQKTPSLEQMSLHQQP
jgi:hypothetical protein